jgi:phage shock protein PspC (stress-responsive transcriptional regulator)
LNGTVPENLPVISRPRGGAMVGGVCAGLARQWRVDPNLLRISVVVLAFFGGLGVAAYGAGLLLMPREGQTEMPVRRILPFTRSWSTPAVVAATIGAGVVLVGLTSSGGIGLGPVLIIFAVWFFGFHNRGAGRPAAQPEPTPFERAADAWRVRLAEQNTPGFEAVPQAAPSEQRWTQPYTDPSSALAVRDNEPPAAIADRRRRWQPWGLAIALVGVGIFVVVMLGLGGLPATPLAYASAVLAALGLTLLLTARSGRPPLLLPATIISGIVTASMLGTAFIGPLGPVGELHRSYSSAAEMPAVIEFGVGDVELDLSRLQLTDDRDLNIRVRAGSVALQLPVGVTSEIDYSIKAGDYNFLGVERGGGDLIGTETVPRGSGEPVLRIRVELDLGEVKVTS